MGVGGDHPKHGVLWAGPKFARFLPGEGLSGKAGCGAVGGLIEGTSSNLWDLFWEGPEGHLYRAPSRQMFRAALFLLLRQIILHLKNG